MRNQEIAQEIEKEFGYAGAVGVGLCLGLFGGLVGSLIAGGMGLGALDNGGFAGAFGGIFAAVLMNKVTRRKLEDHMRHINELKSTHAEEMQRLRQTIASKD